MYVYVHKRYVYVREGGKMTTVSITKLRRQLFDLIEKVSNGEVVAVQRRGREVARIIPVQRDDWRKRTKIRPKLKTSPEDAFAPMEDVWKEYT